MKKHTSKYENIRLTSGKSADEWIKSFPTAYERMLAKEAVERLLGHGLALSEMKLKFTMASLRSSSANISETSDFVAVPHASPENTNSTQVIYVEKSSKSRKGLFVLLFFVGCLIIAFFSNPSLENHQDIVRQRLVSIVQSQVNSKADENPLAFLFFGMLGDKIIDGLVCSNMEYHNYLLFSTTTITIDDNTRTLSVGAFGKIFTVSKEDLKEVAKKRSDNNESKD